MTRATYFNFYTFPLDFHYETISNHFPAFRDSSFAILFIYPSDKSKTFDSNVDTHKHITKHYKSIATRYV